MKRPVFYFILIGFFFGLYSCQEFDSNPKALVNLILVDAPAQWDSVFVEILGADVEVITAGKDDGTIETFFLPYQPGDKKIEVSALVGGEALLLGRDELPAGKILKVTLRLGNEHSLYLDEKEYPLPLTDQTNTEVSLPIELSIDQGLSYDLVLDFDLEKSIKVLEESPLSLQLEPTLTIFRGAGSGELSGSLSPNTIKPAVFAIKGDDSVSTHPSTTGSYEFRLPEGLYSIYFDPKDELYQDTLITNVEIIAGESASLPRVTLKKKP